MIGRIDVGDYHGQPLTVWLDDDLLWQCDDAGLQAYLQRAFKDYSPADGYPGAKLLHDAAEFLDGLAMWLALAETSPVDAVY